MAAPKAVVSSIDGRSTGIPRTLDWICISKSFWDMAAIEIQLETDAVLRNSIFFSEKINNTDWLNHSPPSTSKLDNSNLLSACMASSKSLV